MITDNDAKKHMSTATTHDIHARAHGVATFRILADEDHGAMVFFLVFKSNKIYGKQKSVMLSHPILKTKPNA